MIPLVLALALAAPAQSPGFVAVGTAGEPQTGPLAALTLATGATLKTLDGDATVKPLVSLRQVDVPRPAMPTGAQLITATGDRVLGSISGGDAKTIKFHAEVVKESWSIAPDAVAAVWVTAPPNSSWVTTSLVTVFTTSGPVTNI